MEKNLYIAYGSNMNEQQMAARCPAAKAVGVSTLNDYELLFRGSRGRAAATVEPKKGGSVPVMVWEITAADEEALDRFEDFPRLYRKETVKVKVGRKTADVMVYIMNDGYPLGLPSRYYYNTILQGYQSANIPGDALKAALQRAENPEKAAE